MPLRGVVKYEAKQTFYIYPVINIQFSMLNNQYSMISTFQEDSKKRNNMEMKVLN